MKKKLENKNIITATFIIFGILIIGIIFFVSKPIDEGSINIDEQLSLGEKYLLELDYENAIIAFNKVINVDPMNARAYTGLADAYIGLGDVEKATEVLEEGVKKTDNTEIKANLDKTKRENEVQQSRVLTNVAGSEVEDNYNLKGDELQTPLKYTYYHYVQMYDNMSFRIWYEEGGVYSHYHEIILDEPLIQVDSIYADEGYPTFGHYRCTIENNGFTDDHTEWYEAN